MKLMQVMCTIWRCMTFASAPKSRANQSAIAALKVARKIVSGALRRVNPYMTHVPKTAAEYPPQYCEVGKWADWFRLAMTDVNDTPATITALQITW